MNRSRLRVVAAGAVCVAVLMLSVSEVHAGWGSHGSHGSSGGSYGSHGSSGGSSGSWGSHGSSGSSGSYGSHGSRGSHGSHGGFFARWHHRKMMRHHSSGGSYGSHGSSGGSWGSHGSSGGSYGSSGGSSGSYGSSGGSSGGAVYYSSPVQGGKVYGSPVEGGTIVIPDAGGAGELTPPDPGDQAGVRSSATLTVNVPQDAKIFVNGVQTKSLGAERSYVSRGLQRGLNYTYEVRAEVERDGKKIEETKVVSMRAGQNSQLAFDLKSAAMTTLLTVHVPEAAKVSLAGNETKSTGAVREFKTTKLAAGETWDSYTVSVSIEREGEMLTQEKTITLKAGDSRELSFDFDSPQVAAAG